MTYDIKATLGHEALKQDGRRLFMETMAAANGKNVSEKVASGLQTLLESAWNTKGQTAGAMNLSRLSGYLGGVAELAGALTEAGIGFELIEEGKGPPRMRVRLNQDAGQEPKEDPPNVDVDKLEGPEYEAALAKMTHAERKKYLASA